MLIETPHRASLRITAVGAAIFLAFTILVGRLYEIQVGEGAKAAARADAQRIKKIILPPARGLIADRWGVPLAELRPSVDLDLYLLEIKTHYLKTHGTLPKTMDHYRQNGVPVSRETVDIVKVVETCMAPYREILGDRVKINPDALRLHQRIRDNVPFQLKSDLSFKEIALLYERNPFVPGIEAQPRPVRSYSYGATASHIIGYVGRPEESLTMVRDGREIEVETLGKDGVEKAMDADLQGNPGYRVLEVNNVGSVQKLLDHKNATLGHTVQLTIDLRVQQMAERALAGVGRGACVVLDVRNGDILAMASVPNFDPNTLGDPNEWKRITKDDTHPLLNRAVSSYPPGSTFKIVIALAAALKDPAGLARFSTSCSGGIMVADRYRRCWNTSGCGRLNLIGGIRRSCNVFFYTLGIKTGVTAVHDMASAIGLGEPYSIPIPNADPGVIPSEPWMRANYPRDRWSNGHMANMAIGQGFVKVSPLQMACVAMAVANGGVAYQPRLVSRVVDNNGALVREEPVQVRANLGIDPKAFDLIRRGMWSVVNEMGGTGRRAALPDYDVAGKTGSAQFQTRIRGRSVSDTKTWFISYAPFDAPRYAMCVFVEGGSSGGGSCAPIAGSLYRQIFDLERYNLSYELAYLDPQKGHYDGVRDNPALVDPNSPLVVASNDSEPELEQNDDAGGTVPPRAEPIASPTPPARTGRPAGRPTERTASRPAERQPERPANGRPVRGFRLFR